MKSGQWKLWKNDQNSIVVDVLGHAAYAYLLDKTGSICAHVWLSNLAGVELVSFDAPPTMSKDNILDAAEDFPQSIDLVSVEVMDNQLGWRINWGERSFAELRLGEDVGRSNSIFAGNALAKSLC
jgi:hypothetical protein